MFLRFPLNHCYPCFQHLPGGSSITGLSVDAPSPDPGRLLASNLELAVDKGEAPCSCFGCTGLFVTALLEQCNIASLNKAFTSSACGEKRHDVTTTLGIFRFGEI